MLTFTVDSTAVHIQNHLSYTPTQEKIARKKLQERKSANDQSPNFSIQPRMFVDPVLGCKEGEAHTVR